MTNCYIELRVNYNLDEVPSEEELLEIIRDMYQECAGEVIVDGTYYTYEDGVLKLDDV